MSPADAVTPGEASRSHIPLATFSGSHTRRRLPAVLHRLFYEALRGEIGCLTTITPPPHFRLSAVTQTAQLAPLTRHERRESRDLQQREKTMPRYRFNLQLENQVLRDRDGQQVSGPDN